MKEITTTVTKYKNPDGKIWDTKKEARLDSIRSKLYKGLAVESVREESLKLYWELFPEEDKASSDVLRDYIKRADLLKKLDSMGFYKQRDRVLNIIETT